VNGYGISKILKKFGIQARIELTDAIRCRAGVPGLAPLSEGRDPRAAERARRDILVLDPLNAEARHNLAVLLTRSGPRPVNWPSIDDIIR
jgi:hypothetical protein